MAKGQTIVLSIKSDGSTQGRATVTLSNVVVTVKNPDTVFSTPVNGSYTIFYAGESLTYDTVYQRPSSSNYQLVASPSAGYEFLGWYDETNSELSSSASFSYQGLEDHTIRAVFMHAGSAVYYVKGAFGTFYDCFDLGIAATGNNGVLVVYKDGTLAGSTAQSSFSVPSGRTLLIPCDDAATVYTTSPRSTSNVYVAPTVFRTLTIPENVTVTVDGAISIGGGIFGPSGGTSGAGSPSGPVGRIKAEDGSRIVVNGKLYCWGYIFGSGAVEANSGAIVYEDFQFSDQRGGTAFSSINGNSQKVFPISQYYVQNIEVPLTIHYGAKEIVYTALYIQGDLSARPTLISGDSTSMFTLGSGASITKRYLKETDQLQIDIDGNVSLNKVTMEIYVTVDSSKYVLPLSSNFVVNINSGTTSLNYDTEMLPGTVINIAEGAKLKVSSGVKFYLFDSSEWNMSFFYPGNKINPVKRIATGALAYTRTQANSIFDSRIDVGGEISVQGSMYTSSGGADIVSTNGKGKVTFVTAPASSTTFYQAIQDGSSIKYTSISATAAKLHNGLNRPTAGDYAVDEYTTTAGSSAGTTFNYCSVCDAWYNTVHGHDISTYTVTWKNWDGNVLEVDEEVEDGAMPSYEGNTPQKASDSQYRYVFSGWTPAVSVVTGDVEYTAVFDEIPHTYQTPVYEWVKTGQTYSVTATAVCQDEAAFTVTETVSATSLESLPATCNSAGETTYTATFTGSIFTAQTRTDADIPALGHDFGEWTVTTPATCTEAGEETRHCSRCGETETRAIAASGHDYVDVVTPPTCTSAGYTTHTCSVCGDSYTDTPVEALGHDFGEWTVTTPATCTEAGEETRHCSRCDATETRVIAASGHDYVETVVTQATYTQEGLIVYTCDICGNSYEEIVPKRKAATYSTSLSLDDSIDINFYVSNVDAAADLEKFRIVYTFGETETTGYLNSYLKNHFVIARCAAKEIGDVVNIRVFYSDELINEFNYSARTYCESKLSNAESKIALRDLCKATLDYGAYAQQYFEYNTDNLANAFYSAGTVPDVTIPEELNIQSVTGSCSVITRMSMSLNLLSKTELNFNFTTDGTVDLSDLAVTLNGAEVSAEKIAQLGANKYCLTVDGIAAKELADAQTITISYGNETRTIVYSALTWAVKQQHSTNEATANMAKALYNYYLAALVYFASMANS